MVTKASGESPGPEPRSILIRLRRQGTAWVRLRTQDDDPTTKRDGGAAVVLPDGSVLLVGGYDDQPNVDRTVLSSSVRFVPAH